MATNNTFVSAAFSRGGIEFAHPRFQACFVRLNEAIVSVDLPVPSEQPRHEDEQLRPHLCSTAMSFAHEVNRIVVAVPDICKRLQTPEQARAAKKIMDEVFMNGITAASQTQHAGKSRSSKGKGKTKGKKRAPKAKSASLPGPPPDPVAKELDVVLSSFEKAADALLAASQQYCRGHSERFSADVRLLTKRLLDAAGCALLGATPEPFRTRHSPASEGSASPAASASASRPDASPLHSLRVAQSAGMAELHAKAFLELPRHDAAATMRRLLHFIRLSRAGDEARWRGSSEPPPRPTAQELEEAGGLWSDLGAADTASGAGKGGGVAESGRVWEDEDFDDFDDDDDDDEDDSDDDDDDAVGRASAGTTRGWRGDPRACERWWRAHRAFRQLKNTSLTLDKVLVHSAKALRADLGKWRPDLLQPKARAALAASKAAAETAAGAGAGAAVCAAGLSGAGAGAGSRGTAPSRKGPGTSREASAEWWLVRMGAPARAELALRYAWLDDVAEALDGMSDSMVVFGDAASDMSDPESLIEGAVLTTASLGRLIRTSLLGHEPRGVRELSDAASLLARAYESGGRPSFSFVDRSKKPQAPVPSAAASSAPSSVPSSALLRASARIRKAVSELAEARRGVSELAEARRGVSEVAEASSAGGGVKGDGVEALGMVQGVLSAEALARMREASLESSSLGRVTAQRSEEVDLDASAERDADVARYDTKETEPVAAREAAVRAATEAGIASAAVIVAEAETGEAAGAATEERATSAEDDATAARGGAAAEPAAEAGADADDGVQAAMQCLLADAACMDPLTAWGLAESAMQSMQAFAMLVPELQEQGFGSGAGNDDVDALSQAAGSGSAGV